MIPGEWTRFGWQGIELDLPASWNLSKIDGDRASGYARLDDEDLVRLEVRWAVSKGLEYDLEREMQRQVRMLEKKARKAKLDFVLRRKVRLVKLENRTWECIHWKGDFAAYALLTHCRECGRVLFLQVLFRAGEPGRELCRRIFESLSDHREDCGDLWSVYGLALRLPATWALERSSLRIGEIRLAFAREPERLEAIRVSLAGFHLQQQTLDDWFRRFYQRELEPYRWESRPCTVQGHPGQEVQGRRRWTRRLLAPRRPARLLCRFWHCQASDKLFILRASIGPGGDGLLEEAISTVQCHGRT